MDAETVKNLGGACQIVGVAVVVWDLLALARYRRDLERIAAWLRGWWTARMAAMRRVVGRPRQPRIGYGQASFGMRHDVHATGRTFPGPFTGQPGQSLEDQVAALARLANRLLDEVLKESEERARAISEERRARRAELQAEVERREAAVGELREAFFGLEEVTTGGTRLRWEGVPVLLIGVVFTTWPDGIADGLGWLPWRVLVLVAAFYAAARLTGVLSALTSSSS